MSKMFALVLVGFGLFACYHFWPHETKRVAVKVEQTTISAARAGYEEAKR